MQMPIEDVKHYVSTPSNDDDLEGIYKYLSWHLAKAGMSSNCFHYLEVLYKEAKNTRATDHLLKEIADALQRYVDEYEQWEYAVESVTGKCPNTGIHLDRARAALKKYKRKV